MYVPFSKPIIKQTLDQHKTKTDTTMLKLVHGASAFVKQKQKETFRLSICKLQRAAIAGIENRFSARTDQKIKYSTPKRSLSI